MQHSNETFEGAVVELDGNSYEDCTFYNVVFQYSGGDLQMKNCAIDRFSFKFGGALANGLYAIQQLFGTEALLQIIRGFTEPKPGEVELNLNR